MKFLLLVVAVIVLLLLHPRAPARRSPRPAQCRRTPAPSRWWPAACAACTCPSTRWPARARRRVLRRGSSCRVREAASRCLRPPVAMRRRSDERGRAQRDRRMANGASRAARRRPTNPGSAPSARPKTRAGQPVRELVRDEGEGGRLRRDGDPTTDCGSFSARPSASSAPVRPRSTASTAPSSAHARRSAWRWCWRRPSPACSAHGLARGGADQRRLRHAGAGAVAAAARKTPVEPRRSRACSARPG